MFHSTTASDQTILLASNDATTQMLILDAIEQASLDHISISYISDGEEAIEYLEAACEAQRYPVPLLILTDVNIPLLSGLELLAWIKQHPNLKDIPVIIISDFKDQNQIMQANNLGANSYFVKSSSIDNLVFLMKAAMDKSDKAILVDYPYSHLAPE